MKQKQKHNLKDLQQMQSLSFESKLAMTRRRIMDWYEYWNGNVYVSISGKDSTVLLHIVRDIYPNVKAVFCDTGLEYPEIKELAMSHPNVDIIRPKKPFWQVVRDEGYPLISKEVAECIDNARKYITASKDITHTHTEQRKLPYFQHFRKICGIGEYTPKSQKTSWNFDSKEFP